MATRFKPLVRCPGLEGDDRPCPALIDPDNHPVCRACASRMTRHNGPRMSKPEPKPEPVDHRPASAQRVPPKPQPKPESSLVPCCGPGGAGCPDEALIERPDQSGRRGKRKRCGRCQAILERAKAKGEPLPKQPPHRIRRQQHEHERDRQRAEAKR